MWIIKHELGSNNINFLAIAQAMRDYMLGVDSSGSKFPNFKNVPGLECFVMTPYAGTVWLPNGCDLEEAARVLEQIIMSYHLGELPPTFRTIDSSTLVYTKHKLLLGCDIHTTAVEINEKSNNFQWRINHITQISFELTNDKIDECMSNHMFGIFYDASSDYKSHVSVLGDRVFKPELTIKDFVGGDKIVPGTVYLSTVFPHYQLSLYTALKPYFTKQGDGKPGAYDAKDVKEFLEVYNTFEGKIVTEGADYFLNTHGSHKLFINKPDYKCHVSECRQLCVEKAYVVVDSHSNAIPVMICRWCAHYRNLYNLHAHYVVDIPVTLKQLLEAGAIPEEMQKVYLDVAAYGVKCDPRQPNTLLLGANYIGVISTKERLLNGYNGDRKIVALPSKTKLSVFQ